MAAADWTDLAREGRTLAAIVAYRASAGVGLAEAKAEVERWLDTNLPPSLDYTRAVRVGNRVADRLAEYSFRTGTSLAYWIQVLAASSHDICGRSAIVHAELPEGHAGCELRVEVELPGVPSRLRRQTVLDHLSHGTQMVWLVELDVPTVHVITDPLEHRFYHPGTAFDGGDVLPGFSCKVADLFA